MNIDVKKLCFCLAIIGTVGSLGGCSSANENNDSELVVPIIETIEKVDDSQQEEIEQEEADTFQPEESSKQEEASQPEESLENEPEAEETLTSENDEAQKQESEDNTSNAEYVTYVSENIEKVALNPNWEYAAFSEINTGEAVLYRANENRKNITVGVNAGHGTQGGTSKKTYCHPDGSAKVTGGTTSAGSVKAVAVSSGMTFADGTAEARVTLDMANALKNNLLAAGYDVLMLRDADDVQLDNVARTVISNNMANCHIALHWDGDGLSYDKGCFYISTPDGIKAMEPVASNWQRHEALGEALINGLSSEGCKIYKNGKMSVDLTQTSYSTIPSVDIELGNAASTHDQDTLYTMAKGIVSGINSFFGF